MSIVAEKLTTKWCYKCDQTRPVSEFYTDRVRYDGLQGRCKSCQKAYNQSEISKAAKRKFRVSIAGKTMDARISAKYRATHRAEIQARDAKVHTTLRTNVIVRLGGCCVRCRTTENLEVDHVNENGKWHRIMLQGQNKGHKQVLRWALKTPLAEVLHGKYAIQLLCNACHRTKDHWAALPDLFFSQVSNG